MKFSDFTRVCSFLFFAVLGSACSNALAFTSGASSELSPTKFSNSQDCQSCHQAQFSAWEESHHADAMRVPSADTVLADFAQSSATHFSQEAIFYIDNGEYFATVKDSNSERTYKVAYTFGVYPLQQYLVATENGKYQVLPFAWDTRVKEEGGQRWMHLYPKEDIAFNDRLHWQQPLQNWNGMCADCHSDGLVRGFDDETNVFNTRFDEVNVGCLACHDDKREIHSTAKNKNPTETTLNNQGFWLRKPEQAVASWQGGARDTTYEQTCYACHSLRAPLTDGFDSTSAYLDQFTPNLITPPLYYADGQILEEVYVMGSFMQSKMAQKGVTCVDCHDPHSYKIKTQGNGMCLQCHSPQVFETPKHHGHSIKTAQTDQDLRGSGTQCVDCHMPKTTYMNVDARGDHSFKIPRPEFTISAGVPNACNQCHQDESPQWALAQIESWHPDRAGPAISEQMFLNLFNGLDYQNILRLASNQALPPIKRATAISVLQYVQALPARDILSFLNSDDALIRMAAAQVAERLTGAERQHYLAPLLSDDIRAVRIAAAYALLGVEVQAQWQQAFENAFKELTLSHTLSAWRGEGRMQQGMTALRTGQRDKAEEAYRVALFIDPYFPPAYINLIELYRQTGQTKKAEEIYLKGLKNIPESGVLRYSYALKFVRDKALESALEQINAALDAEPRNAQFAYLYYLILDSMGKRDQAKEELRNKLESYDNNQQLRALINNWGA
ncbi:ammonia-forming cytochrome c nitrite reductase subunit c552 [Ningiella sp. W23]|uniref:ammonia-forming cytochrome c nitrite reductase subunit c552 n=1 Tax=Ningiella sp. W23 TaxID=3023715 RepID=UPI0037565A36